MYAFKLINKFYIESIHYNQNIIFVQSHTTLDLTAHKAGRGELNVHIFCQ